ncbi:MAG: glycosyltransferase family 4 protein [Candidatus Eisenbacteria bacterium]
MLRIIARLNVGGPAIHTVLLTSGLEDRVFHSTLVTGVRSESEGDMGYLAREAGVEPRVIPEIGRELTWRNDLVALWKLVGLMRELRPWIVHTHTAKAGALGRLAAILAGVPIRVHTFHGHVFHGYFGPLKTRMFIGIERLLGRFTDRIVAISERQLEELCDIYRVAPRARFAVIPLGFDLRSFAGAERHRGELRRALGVPDGRALIGIIGRLVPIKNHAMFLDAARRILDARGDAGFVIVGDGELRGELERTVREHGLSDRVYFLGWRRDLDVIYADLDVVALTSNNEGTPVAVIEAMAAGRPVVSTRVGGAVDVVEDEGTGLLVPAGDATAFTRAVLRLLADPALRARLGARGRELALARYDSARLVADVRRLYLELLAGKRMRVPAAEG